MLGMCCPQRTTFHLIQAHATNIFLSTPGRHLVDTLGCIHALFSVIDAELSHLQSYVLQFNPSIYIVVHETV